MLRDLLAVLVFGITIAAVLTRPRGLPEWMSCVAGALLVLVLRIVSPGAAADALLSQWDVLLFFVGLLLVSWAAEQAGVFGWAALWIAAHAGGSPVRLLFNTFAAGIVLTTVLSNDATALLLTTTVIAVTERLDLPVLPFALACAFIANSASMTLPVSNPLNILVLGAGGVHLLPYLAHMLAASAVVIGLTVLLFWLRFRRQLGGTFDPARVPAPASAIEHPRLFRITVAVLILLAAAYVAASAAGWPLSLPVLVAGVVLLAAVLRLASIPARAVAGAPWSIVPFVAGLLVVVRGLERTGLTHGLGTRLLTLEGQGNAIGVLGATGVSALGANVLNNLPMGAVMVSALRTAHAASHPGLLYGTLLGSDVGPNLTVFGALSSMLWLLLLRRRGVSVTAWEFARWGFMVTPLLLLAGVAAIILSG